MVELSQMHTGEQPIPPSQRLGQPVPPELENAILACLEKSRARRPQTARELARLLDTCPAASEWSLDQADAWWNNHDRGTQPTSGPSTGQRTTSSEQDATMLFE